MFLIFPLGIISILTVALLLYWAGTGNKIYGKALGWMWLGIILLISISITINWLTSKKELKKTDYYGDYIINRQFFRGLQADWQYNTFRFEILPNDSIYFHVTNKDKILRTYKGTISTIKPYSSERLIVGMTQPSYHVLKTNPTIYRSAWSFYLVFNSPCYGNMYFVKGHWKPLDDQASR